MKRKLSSLSQRYVTALKKHLKQGPRASLQPALRLGRQSLALGLETLELTRIHERALVTLKASNGKNGLSKRVERFFNKAITPLAKTHRASLKTNARLNQVNDTLGRHTTDLAATNRSLRQGIAKSRTLEQVLKKSAEHGKSLLEESRSGQKRLRHLTHQLLSAQEAERKKISHELQDEVGQSLLAINVRLLSLKNAARGSTANLRKEIANTQQLVEESLKSINRLAHELDVY
jgi:signal transduction histidine kinase